MRTTFRGLEGVVHRLTDLPVKKHGMRWSYMKKAMIIGAVRAGALTEEQACHRYDLSPEELRGWGTSYDARGFQGLKVTKRA